MFSYYSYSSIFIVPHINPPKLNIDFISLHIDDVLTSNCDIVLIESYWCHQSMQNILRVKMLMNVSV